MEGLIREAETQCENEIPPMVLDGALVAATQRIEQYEMAGYGTARAFAEKLGEHDSADRMQQTLEDEGHANQRLTRLAERSLNFIAMTTTEG